MKTNIRARNAIQRAIAAIDREIELESLPHSGAMSRNQLEKFRVTLAEMLCEIDCNTVVSQSYDGGIGRIIADSWPLDSILGEAVLEAEQTYFEFKSVKKQDLVAKLTKNVD